MTQKKVSSLPCSKLTDLELKFHALSSFFFLSFSWCIFLFWEGLVVLKGPGILLLKLPSFTALPNLSIASLQLLLRHEVEPFTLVSIQGRHQQEVQTQFRVSLTIHLAESAVVSLLKALSKC